MLDMPADPFESAREQQERPIQSLAREARECIAKGHPATTAWRHNFQRRIVSQPGINHQGLAAPIWYWELGDDAGVEWLTGQLGALGWYEGVSYHGMHDAGLSLWWLAGRKHGNRRIMDTARELLSQKRALYGLGGNDGGPILPATRGASWDAFHLRQVAGVTWEGKFAAGSQVTGPLPPGMGPNWINTPGGAGVWLLQQALAAGLLLDLDSLAVLARVRLEQPWTAYTLPGNSRLVCCHNLRGYDNPIWGVLVDSAGHATRLGPPPYSRREGVPGYYATGPVDEVREGDTLRCSLTCAVGSPGAAERRMFRWSVKAPLPGGVVIGVNSVRPPAPKPPPNTTTPGGQQPQPPPKTGEPADAEWGILEVVETVTTTHRVPVSRSLHPVDKWMTDARAGGRKLWDEAGAHVKSTEPYRTVSATYRRPR